MNRANSDFRQHRACFAKICLVFIFLFNTSKCSFGQQVHSLQLTNIGSDSERISFNAPILPDAAGKVLFGPDPRRARDLLHLLKHEPIQQELRLSDAEAERLKNIVHDHQSRSKQLSKEGFTDLVKVKKVLQTIDEESELVIDELLPPEKKNRLVQMAYRFEISIVGLGTALTNGRLSTEVKIYENQITKLQDRSLEIEARLKKDILKLKEKAELELLEHLSPEQRQSVIKLIGTPFDFHEIGPIEQSVIDFKRNSNPRR
jgi:hypothetical protein